MKAAAALPLLCLAIGGAGCAPALLWYGHDPARQARLELRADKGHQWLVESGRPASAARPPGVAHSAAFDAIVMSDLVWSADGRHHAVPARRNGKWHMVVDLTGSPAWDGVAAPVFAATGDEVHVAYPAESGGQWLIVRDGRPGPRHSSIIEGTLAFSPDGRRLGYGAAEAGCARIWVDGQATACHRNVRQVLLANQPERDRFVVQDDVPSVTDQRGVHRLPGLVHFGGDGAGRWFAVAVEDAGARLFVDGASADDALEIRDVAYSPRGKVVYAARRDDGWYLVNDGRAEGPYRELRPATFSPDGGRYGYVARAVDGSALVVVDGRVRGTWPGVEGLVFSPDGRRIAYAARRGTDVGIVCEDRLFVFDVVVETTIAFSVDGNHWAALVGSRRSRRMQIVVDGRDYLPFDSEELFGGAAQGAAPVSQLRSWVAAELERHLRKGSR